MQPIQTLVLTACMRLSGINSPQSSHSTSDKTSFKRPPVALNNKFYQVRVILYLSRGNCADGSVGQAI